MESSRFYQLFEDAFSANGEPSGFIRQSGRGIKWKVPIQDGALYLRVTTNSRSSGLLEHKLWPGEFGVRAEWQRGKGSSKRLDRVSIFQYFTEHQLRSFEEAQAEVLGKYLSMGGIDSQLSLGGRLEDRSLLEPRPNVEGWCYFVDEEDVQEWGRWYRGSLSECIERFVQAPESLEDWCWRVLWAHLKRERS